ncbi:hypothetical protein CDD82_608 [Ophiocordyceps australis]|uniref:Copper acquisition factor BIM1-like domain-containing protein n=1 Tax=Ophiocordyceps australis TaxID=1399860 RepID=A0A2C5ZNB4_9HYPO|nr:hypothetical protein CDD82_608 [Ophiocordyceps australis]
MKLLALTTVFSSLALAHFEMVTPSSIGFSDDDENKAPCGGFTPDFTKDVVDYPVGGAALGMRSTHQQSNWLFRGTLDEKAEKGWKQMFPIVMQSGLGDFCEPSVPAPAQWAGKKGVVSVVSSATDGLLYQCVAVNFVNGTQDQQPSQCRNGTAKGSFTTDSRLTALVDNGDSSGGGNTGASSTGGPSATRTASPQASSSHGAAALMQAPAFASGLLALIGAFVLA